jgi:hypothetical protein
MKDLEEEVPHECRKHNLAGLAAESSLVSAQVPSLHQYRFQTSRVAPVRWPACAVLSASGAMQILLAAVLLDRTARPGIDRRKFGLVSARGRIFLGLGEGDSSDTKCSTLCDREPPKWSLKVSQKGPNGRLKFPESLSGAPGNCPKQG